MYSKNIEEEIFSIYIHRIKTKNDITIEEVINVFDGTLISYKLTGISEDDYLNIYSNSRVAVCYTSFDDCYYNLQNSIASNPLDDMICDLLPCGVINYSACTIMKGSGYTRDSSGYVGDENCEAIYDRDGNDLKN